ncbi:MAG TPA: DNA polymerase III subunit delta [Candidatus Fraserbacteria bacterium]|nr:DNA polymerase III subunit delta [Candidatus Fraserbacteria bacterium]
MSRLYLFSGEPTLRRRAIRQLIAGLPEAPQVTQLDAEETRPRDLLQALQTAPLFAERSIIWVKNIEKLSEPEPLTRRLAQPLPPLVTVIFEAEKLDRRGRFYKALAHQGQVQDFPPVERRELPGLVKQMLAEQGVRLSPEGFRYLLEVVSPDLGRLEREIAKLALYSEGRSLSLAELEGLLFADKGGNVFQFIDALLERRPEALGRLQALLDGGEDPNKLFFLIVGQVRALLTVSSLAAAGLSAEEITTRTRQFSWLIRKRLQQVKKLSQQKLVNWLLLLQSEDACLKRGERDPAEALLVVALAILLPAVC